MYGTARIPLPTPCPTMMLVASNSVSLDSLSIPTFFSVFSMFHRLLQLHAGCNISIVYVRGLYVTEKVCKPQMSAMLFVLECYCFINQYIH